jgi:hypothetical protein
MGEEIFNEDLLEQGYGQLYTVSPNTEYEDRFEAAQDEAREEDLGIWGLSTQEQCELANHGNGIGEGSPECQKKKETAPAASEDYDCEDFDTQAEAQTILDSDPSDPYNLDPDDDGSACEDSGSGASPSPAPDRSPNRNYDAPDRDYDVPGTAPSTASPGAGGAVSASGLPGPTW